MTTESESRMREALEEARQYIAGASDRTAAQIDTLIFETLSPPARRTSFEWEDEYGVDCRVRWSGSAWISEWVVGDPEQWVEFGHPAAAGAIATLANLTPPEDES